jgi:large subunit ribosomal protein L25
MGTVDSVVLQAESRQSGGSGEARRVRASGKVPIVVYGEGRNDSLQVNAHGFALMLKRHGEHQILDLVVDGTPSGKVLVQDVQHEVRDGHILHADLVVVSMDKAITLSLPLRIDGDAVGLKSGGVLELVHAELEVECLPGDVVEEIPVDVTHLEVGDTLTAGAVVLPPGLTLAGDPHVVILTIAQPKLEKVEGEETAAAGDKPAADK